MSNYDIKTSKNYLKFANADPAKKYSQYPSIICFLGNVNNKLVLDVGCGNGFVSRKLSRFGAKVVGYDISNEQIRLAKERSNNYKNLEFFVSKPKYFKYSKKFDLAFASMVLCYSKNLDMLQSFFDSTYNVLSKKGKFIVLDADKSIVPINIPFCGRVFSKTDAGLFRSNFLKNKKISFYVDWNGYSKDELISCAKKAGFKKIIFKKPIISKSGLKARSIKYWKTYFDLSPFIVMICKK